MAENTRYKIIGETIKSATSIKIGEIFKTESTKDGQIIYNYPKRYKENITKMTYPNFFIDQINLIISPAGTHSRVKLDYLMQVRYRVAEDTAIITNLQQQLDEVGLKLCSELTELNLEKPTKTKNRQYEKSDGVLIFSFEVTVFAVPDIEKLDPLEKYILNEEVIQ